MDYPVQKILELACAAQRINGEYNKETTPVYSDDFKIMGYKFSNKALMLRAVEDDSRIVPGDHVPSVIFANEEDKSLTDEIRSYYRRLMFNVMADPNNTFQQEILSLLNTEMMPGNKFGFIACLPSVYYRDRKRNDMTRTLRECDNLYLSDVDSKIFDVQAKIVDCTRSKNFDAFNITAIIDNKVVSWFSKKVIDNPEVKIKLAKVKAHQQHWISKKAETRLNYVKVVE
jgi:hypothetical protein